MLNLNVCTVQLFGLKCKIGRKSLKNRKHDNHIHEYWRGFYCKNWIPNANEMKKRGSESERAGERERHSEKNFPSWKTHEHLLNKVHYFTHLFINTFNWKNNTFWLRNFARSIQRRLYSVCVRREWLISLSVEKWKPQQHCCTSHVA